MTGQQPQDQEWLGGRKFLEVRETEDVVLTVAEIPGAGYEWVLRDLPPGLTLLGSDWAGAMPSGVGGARGRTFRLRADRRGTYVVALDLVRPWEPADTPPAQNRTVELVVTAPPPAPPPAPPRS